VLPSLVTVIFQHSYKTNLTLTVCMIYEVSILFDKMHTVPKRTHTPDEVWETYEFLVQLLAVVAPCHRTPIHLETKLYASLLWTVHVTHTGRSRHYNNRPVLGKILFTCIFDTDTDTWSQMYLKYRYKILYFKCIKDTDTTKKYLDTRYIEDRYSLIGMFKCYFFNKK